MRRVLLIALVALLLPAAAATATPSSSSRATSPRGVASGSRIVRDGFGIAHVLARNEHDLMFLNGWVHAQDRLFQMDTRRRQAAGTLAEVLGPDAIGSDVQLRTLGLRRAAERSLAVLSSRSRVDLQAYADGVNAWVASNPLPPEYGVLHLTRFAPWTPLDTVAVGKLIAFGLSFDLDTDLTFDLLPYAQAGVDHGFDGFALFFQDLFRTEPFNHATTVLDAQGRPGAAARDAAAHASMGVLRLAAKLAPQTRRYLQQARGVEAMQKAIQRDWFGGSNQWAVAGKNTSSGAPMFSTDQHLSLDSPSTFYPIHLKDPTIDVIGSGFAGAPGVVVGKNHWVTWGATVNPSDVTDTFLEAIHPDPTSPSGLSTEYKGKLEHVVAIPEVFRANNPASGKPDDVTVVPPGGQVPAATLIVPRRDNGPIILYNQGIGLGFSVQYTGFSATRELDAFLAFDQARGLSDFQKGLQLFDFGSQNFIYADIHGNIAYFAPAEIPVREDLQAGRVDGNPPFITRDGRGGNEWLPVIHPQPGQAVPHEILPASELPHAVNPPAGFLVNANNDPVGTSLDNDPLNQARPGGGIYYLNPGYDGGFRAGRITQLIRAKLAHHGKISFQDMERIQADTAMLDAQYFVPWVRRAWAHAQSSGDPALRALAGNAAVKEAVGRLARWDFSTPTGIPEGYDGSDPFGLRLPPSQREVANSVAATIYSVWRSRFVHNTVDATLAPFGLPQPDSDRSLSALKHLLDNFATTGGKGASGLDFFSVPGVAAAADRRDVLLLRSIADALDRLASPDFAAAFHGSHDQGSYRWGLLHRMVLRHPLGGAFDIPPANGFFPAPLPGLAGIPRDGGFGTVNVGAHSVRADSVDGFMFGSGSAQKYTAEGRPSGMRAVSVWPGGASGVPGSPFYVNMLPLWLTGDPFPLLGG